MARAARRAPAADKAPLAAPAGPAVAPTPEAMLVVRGPTAGFWRAGRLFGPEPVAIPLGALSPGEIAAIESEPMLLSARVAAGSPPA